MKNYLALASVPLLAVSAPVFAAVPAEVTTAFTELSADLVTVGGLVVIATLGVAVWKFVQAIII